MREKTNQGKAGYAGHWKHRGGFAKRILNKVLRRKAVKDIEQQVEEDKVDNTLQDLNDEFYDWEMLDFDWDSVPPLSAEQKLRLRRILQPRR